MNALLPLQQIFFRSHLHVPFVCVAGDKRVRAHIVNLRVISMSQFISTGSCERTEWMYVAVGDNDITYSATTGERVAENRLHTLQWEIGLGETITADIDMWGRNS